MQILQLSPSYPTAQFVHFAPEKPGKQVVQLGEMPVKESMNLRQEGIDNIHPHI
jgi:uncharacterized protein YpmS